MTSKLNSKKAQDEINVLRFLLGSRINVKFFVSVHNVGIAAFRRKLKPLTKSKHLTILISLTRLQVWALLTR